MRYKGILSYDGTQYSGYQKQVNDPTIQSELEKAFLLMTRIPTDTFAASRTDKGVHALHQVFHFDSELDLTSSEWTRALNKRLPEDIRILKIVKVKPDFHARHMAKSKIYTYKISKKPLSAFKANHEVYSERFNYDIVKDLLKVIEGTHDFSGFSPNKELKPPIKTIYSFKSSETKTHYIFKIHGNHFLRFMVRIIMGNVIAIGEGKKPINQLELLLETKDRNLSAMTAPAKGLYLTHIYYR